MELSDSVEAVVKELKAKEDADPLAKASCDILRSMIILYGSAWETDLSDTLAGLWSVRGVPLEKISDMDRLVPKAIELLNEKGVLTSIKKYKGDLSRAQPIEEVLHTVKGLTALIQIFSGDREIEKYRRDIMGYGGIGFR